MSAEIKDGMLKGKKLEILREFGTSHTGAGNHSEGIPALPGTSLFEGMGLPQDPWRLLAITELVQEGLINWPREAVIGRTPNIPISLNTEGRQILDGLRSEQN